MGTICSNPPASPEAEVVAKTATPLEDKVSSSKASIKVYGCRGLRNADWSWLPGTTNLSDAYVICTEKKANQETTTLLQTKTIPNSLEPIFDQEFDVDFADESTLEFTVYDKDPLKPDDLLGRAILKRADLVNGFNGELPLEDAGKNIKAYIKILVKTSGSDYPAGPAAEFNIKIPKGENNDMGFTVDRIHSGVLYVTSINASGPMKKYNDTAGVNEQMKVGQYIVVVNGVRDDTVEMAKALESATVLELSMERPYCFSIAIKKSGTLGLHLAINKVDKAVAVRMISKVDEGPVLKWNKAHPTKEVQPNDIIVAVNGNRDLGDKQMEFLKEDGSMQLVFSRRNPQAGALKTFWDWF